MGFPVVSVAGMRALEAAAAASGIAEAQLMQTAGAAIAGRIDQQWPRHVPVTVLAGPGNNGGDGLVAARHLATAGRHVIIRRHPARPDDALLASAVAAGARLGSGDAPTGLVVDALFGTGLNRPLDATARELLRSIPESALLLAVDVPSGGYGDTGACDDATPLAALTLSLGAMKRGHFCYPLAARLGILELLDIGLPGQLVTAIDDRTVEAADVAELLPPRPVTAHKGSAGRVLIVAGSDAYPGAVGLAALGAHRGGAGLVTLVAPRPVRDRLAGQLLESTWSVPPTDGPALDETVLPLLTDALSRAAAIVVGPGLGRDDATTALVAGIVGAAERLDVPLVVDADGLWHLAELGPASPHGRLVITPHAGEAARLLGATARAVEADRFASARRLALDWKAVAVLKGPNSLITDGARLRVVPLAVPALATAGSGDVLAGLLGALAASGLAPFEAAVAAVALHAHAGQHWSSMHGDRGLLARELADLLPSSRRRMAGIA